MQTSILQLQWLMLACRLVICSQLYTFLDVNLIVSDDSELQLLRREKADL
jgi:hypothetical protein